MCPFFPAPMAIGVGGMCMMMDFHILIFFKITVKKCGSKSYNYINDHPDHPAFVFGAHIKQIYL
jgi:hypothetical protein